MGFTSQILRVNFVEPVKKQDVACQTHGILPVSLQVLCPIDWPCPVFFVRISARKHHWMDKTSWKLGLPAGVKCQLCMKSLPTWGLSRYKVPGQWAHMSS